MVVEGALAWVSVAELMTVAPVTVPAHSSLADVADSLAGTARHTAYPAASPHGIVGLLPFGTLIDHPPPSRATTGVDECMLPLDAVPQLAPNTSASTALEQLTASHVGRARPGRRTPRGILSTNPPRADDGVTDAQLHLRRAASGVRRRSSDPRSRLSVRRVGGDRRRVPARKSSSLTPSCRRSVNTTSQPSPSGNHPHRAMLAHPGSARHARRCAARDRPG